MLEAGFAMPATCSPGLRSYMSRQTNCLGVPSNRQMLTRSALMIWAPASVIGRIAVERSDVSLRPSRARLLSTSKIAGVAGDFSDLHWSVDTPADLAVVAEVIAAA